jgi:hypothetical protein
MGNSNSTDDSRLKQTARKVKRNAEPMFAKYDDVSVRMLVNDFQIHASVTTSICLLPNDKFCCDMLTL